MAGVPAFQCSDMTRKKKRKQKNVVYCITYTACLGARHMCLCTQRGMLRGMFTSRGKYPLIISLYIAVDGTVAASGVDNFSQIGRASCRERV